VQTTANNTTTVQYIDATLMLNVTPQITEAGTIAMQINVQKKEPLTGLQITGGANAPLSTREAQTQVMVKDGGTTVIGGIYQITDNNSQNRIPFLYQLPIIGNLFKNRNISRRHDELLIFITPRVVKSF
jgi:type IV pilus assembly protein PilQ